MNRRLNFNSVKLFPIIMSIAVERNRFLNICCEMPQITWVANYMVSFKTEWRPNGKPIRFFVSLILTNVLFSSSKFTPQHTETLSVAL